MQHDFHAHHLQLLQAQRLRGSFATSYSTLHFNVGMEKNGVFFADGG